MEKLKLDHNIYKILLPCDYDPENENWEFKPNTVVKCEEVLKNGKIYLVARAEVV